MTEATPLRRPQPRLGRPSCVHAPAIEPGLMQALQKMQNRAVQQQQNQLSQQEAHKSMEEKRSKVMPAYVERAVSRVKAKGVNFENIEPTMADTWRRISNTA